MHKSQSWHDSVAFRRTHLLSSATLSIFFLLLNFVVNSARQHSNDASNFPGLLFIDGNFTDVTCVGSGKSLDNTILSVASWLPGDDDPSQKGVAGRCFFNESLAQLLDSFSTEFTFTLAPITSNVSQETIDGIAFIIFQDSSDIGGAEGYLGVYGNGSVSKAAFAIEFDTFTNSEFNDPPYHHVGVDIGSMNSSLTAAAGYDVDCYGDFISKNVSLTGDGRIQAWIDYDGSAQNLSIFMSSNMGYKPPEPLLTFEVNLSEIFQTQSAVYFGFSSSTGKDFPGWAYVLGWSLNVLGAATPLYPISLVQCAECSSGRYDPGEVCSPFCNTPPDVCPVFVVRPPSPPPSAKFDLGLTLGVSLSTSVVVIMVGVFLGGWYLLRVRKSLRRQFELVELENLDYRPKQYSYKELSKATENFSPELELGRGGFGVVYKGTFASSTGSSMIAVKKIIPRRNSVQSQHEYVSEMRVIGRLRHRNLVQLLGWCHEKKGELMQVYEYLPNGSLDKFLFNRTRGDEFAVLTWDQRFHIITGVAAALVYLHEEWKQLILHRDVKASNVMLDSDFNARLGDFGLARLYEHRQTLDITAVAGTIGYMAPEIMNGEFTEKSDVYSFGIVALEVATGRRSIDFQRPPGEEQLVVWVLNLSETGRIPDAADLGLNGNFGLDELLRVVHVGLLCSHPDPAERPTVRHALQMLNGESPLMRLSPARPETETGFEFHLQRDRTDSRTDLSQWDRPNTDIEDPDAPLFVDYTGHRFQHSMSFSGPDSGMSGRTL